MRLKVYSYPAEHKIRLVKVVRQLECLSLPEAMARVLSVPFEVKVVDASIHNMKDAQDTLNKCLGAGYAWEKAEDAPAEPKKGLEVKVRFKLGDMEMFGAHSLTGRIMKENSEVAYDAITKLVIEFEETTSAWKRNNKGPHLTLMPEYVPAELIRDLLNWTRRGVEIEVVEVLADPR